MTPPQEHDDNADVDERDPSDDERAGMAWWNSLSEGERAAWLGVAGSAIPADAWAARKRALEK